MVWLPWNHRRWRRRGVWAHLRRLGGSPTPFARGNQPLRAWGRWPRLRKKERKQDERGNQNRVRERIINIQPSYFIDVWHRQMATSNDTHDVGRWPTRYDVITDKTKRSILHPSHLRWNRGRGEQCRKRRSRTSQRSPQAWRRRQARSSPANKVEKWEMWEKL